MAEKIKRKFRWKVLFLSLLAACLFFASIIAASAGIAFLAYFGWIFLGFLIIDLPYIFPLIIVIWFLFFGLKTIYNNIYDFYEKHPKKN